MATWQFDLHCVSAEVLYQSYGGIPQAMAQEEYERISWWQNPPCPDLLRKEISALLPSSTSWSEEVEIWGTDQGDRIELTWRDGQIVDFFVRVDVRAISRTFLIGFLELARKYNWLLFTGDGRVLQPLLSELLAAIKQSESCRYVEDPEGFLLRLQVRGMD